ncbi:hypothetical protein [Rhodococcus sp. IEGM 1307]|uniref:hypothetical protein n=1 Tax=Rhodococcus sp. IEGM 1307 TaxID=3047091 RepID=UPI0024B6FA77|nr:hypothetical protein [Rhodococcus sp. IEGM 1307]MDI9978571.1 hypothetical protein [Rhodococcus sp. IEGM 1307]
MGSLYRRSLSERGYREQVEAVLAGNPTHDTTDVPALVLLDELTVWGTPDTAHDQLQHWYTAAPRCRSSHSHPTAPSPNSTTCSKPCAHTPDIPSCGR